MPCEIERGHDRRQKKPVPNQSCLPSSADRITSSTPISLTYNLSTSQSQQTYA